MISISYLFEIKLKDERTLPLLNKIVHQRMFDNTSRGVQAGGGVAKRALELKNKIKPSIGTRIYKTAIKRMAKIGTKDVVEGAKRMVQSPWYKNVATAPLKKGETAEDRSDMVRYGDRNENPYIQGITYRAPEYKSIVRHYKKHPEGLPSDFSEKHPLPPERTFKQGLAHSLIGGRFFK